MTRQCADCGSTTRSLLCGQSWAGRRRGTIHDPCSCRVFRCVTDWRAHGKAQKARGHEKMVSRVYGLLPGEYERLYRIQGGKCAILHCPARGTGRKRLAVDHCHTTGRVRGLLCSTHNRLLGAMGDNPTVFRSMAEYLELPPAYSV